MLFIYLRNDKGLHARNANASKGVNARAYNTDEILQCVFCGGVSTKNLSVNEIIAKLAVKSFKRFVI